MKKIYTFIHKRQIHILFVISLIATWSGIIAYRMDSQPWSETLYRTLQFFKFNSRENENHSVYYEIARWLAAIVIVFSVIKLIMYFIKDQLDEIVIHLFYRQHIIICGMSKKALILLNDSSLKKMKIVIIEKNKDIENISDFKFKKGIKIIIGDAQDEKILKRSNIFKASYVFAFTNSDQTNLNIANQIQEISNKRTSKRKALPIKVRIHLSDHFKLSIFKEFHMDSDGKIDFHAFNLYQQAAEKIIDEYSPDKFISIKKEDKSQVHILIAGFGSLGEFVLYEAAQMYHFANLNKLRVTITDHEIGSKLEKFMMRFPAVKEIVDINPIEQNDFDNVDQKIALSDVSVCFLCFDDDAYNLRKAYNFRQYFFSIHKTFESPKIVTVLPQNDSIKELFKQLELNYSELNIEIKELYEDFCKKRIIVDNKEDYDYIAKYIDYIYETNENESQRRKAILSNIEKHDQNVWNKKTDFEKDWNRYPARHFNIKLRMSAIDLENTSDKSGFDFNLALDEETKLLIAKVEHRRWCAEKLLTGFHYTDQVEDKQFGKFLKRKLKLHPDLVDWDKLSKGEQLKDDYTFDNLVFIAYCKKILKK